tara:strand:+ start:1588 stop:2376 length:789 start_codon:yes stop_codon:yes gene_type:complete
MARDTDNESGADPAGTPATSAASKAIIPEGLYWAKEKVAEDEISTLWRNVAPIETPEQAEIAAAATRQNHFWPSIKAMADECDILLNEQGFPSAARKVLHLGDGRWSDLPPLEEFKKSGGQIVNGEWLARHYTKGFSDAWYAGRIGLKCRLALGHLQKGDAGEPFLLALIFEIASLRTDWRWRRQNKSSIITGRGVRKGSELGGEMRSKSFAPDTKKRLEEMRRLIGEGHSQNSAACALARRGVGKSRDANLKLWQRHAGKT